MSEPYDRGMSAPQSPTGPVDPPPAPVLDTPPTPDPPVPPAPEPQWSSAQKLAFRLLFVIGGGIVLLSIFGNVGVAVLWYFTGLWWVLAQIGSYLARGEGVDVYLSNVGDLAWNWYWHLGWIVVSLVIVAVWTALDRSRPNYLRLAGLLEAFARVGLALSMIYYGLVKLIPSQMGFMDLPAHQLQLVGDTSMFTVLWGFMGASTPYSMATGFVELTAGLLLLWRRTYLLGLLVALVATTQVFLLNLFYDVPVKLVSGELVIVTVALLARYAPNLLRVALNRGGAEPVLPLPLPGPRRLRTVGVVATFIAAGLIFATGVLQGVLVVTVVNTVRSPLDGEWRATSVTVDGAPATLTQRDPAPWANLAITMRGKDSPGFKELSAAYDSMVTQTAAGYTTVWDLTVDNDVLEMRKKKDDPPLRVTARLEGDRLHLTATIDGKRVEGVYERRFMERERSHFRLIQPDKGASGTDSSSDQGGS